MKKNIVAILCLLWSGFFCLFVFLAMPVQVYAQGTQISSAKQVIRSERFAAIAQQKIETELLNMGESRRHELQLIRAPQAMTLPQGAVVCEAELPQKLRYGNTNPVHLSVFVNGSFYRRVICYYRLNVYDNVLVAVHDLRIDKPIALTDVRVEERKIGGGAGRYLTQPADIQGRVPSRIIKAGAALESLMLQNPVVFDVGAPVTIVVKNNGIEVSTDGVAMQRGRLGAMVRVRNAASGRILRGKVVAAATVEIIN